MEYVADYLLSRPINAQRIYIYINNILCIKITPILFDASASSSGSSHNTLRQETQTQGIFLSFFSYGAAAQRGTFPPHS